MSRKSRERQALVARSATPSTAVVPVAAGVSEFVEKDGNPTSAKTGATTSTVLKLSEQTASPRRGVRELQTLYSQSPWLRAIVGKISQSVADVDWGIYAKRGNGQPKFIPAPDIIRIRNAETRALVIKSGVQDGTLAEITTHPLLDMLERGTGNPMLSGHAAMMVTEIHLELAGEAFWLIEMNELGAPHAYWPLPPAWVIKKPTNKEPFYTVNLPHGTRVTIPSEFVVPFVDVDPNNPYERGTGIAQALDDEVQIDEFAAKHQKSFFLNRARPDIIISGQFISQNDTKRLEQQWLADHTGFWKAFKPLFFSQKIDVKELTQTFESMQMIQVRKQERDTFINVFGVPPEKFGIIGDSKRSTIQTADLFWNKDVIKPRAERIRRSLQAVLAPKFDERIIVGYDTPVIQQDEYNLEVMKASGWTVTMNEWREARGAPSLGPAGEVVLVPRSSVLVPVKTANGDPISTPEAVAQQHMKLVAESGPVPEQFETESIARELVEGITAALTPAIEELKRSVRSTMEEGMLSLSRSREQAPPPSPRS